MLYKKKMKMVVLLVISHILSLCLPSKAYAGDLLEVSQVSVESELVQLGVNYGMGSKGEELVLVDKTSGQSIPFEEQLKPINLKIIVDTSSLCMTQNLSDYISSLVRDLSRKLPAQSMVSLVSYNSGSMEFLASYQHPEDFKPNAILCDAQRGSKPFETPFARLLETKSSDDLESHFWVFSAGSVSMSESLLAQLEKQKVNTHVFVYNPYVYANVSKQLAKYQQRLGRGKLTFSQLDSKSKYRHLPLRIAKIHAYPPLALWGQKGLYQMSVQSKEGQILSQYEMEIVLPKAPSSYLKSEILKKAVMYFLVLMLVLLGLRILLSYRRKRCTQCKSVIPFEKNQCPLCLSHHTLYLVTEGNLVDKKKPGRPNIVPLDYGVNEIGTHKKSKVLLPFGYRSKRRKLARIEVMRAENEELKVGLKVSASGYEVLVNGTPCRDFRFLAVGDRLVLEGYQMQIHQNITEVSGA